MTTPAVKAIDSVLTSVGVNTEGDSLESKFRPNWSVDQ